MPGASTSPRGPEPLDKRAVGQRIRQIRLRCRLKQRELAAELGTSQSAIHKYEHGVIPEARRLLALARLGGTTIEWILTGRHWENGSARQERVEAELLALAARLRDLERRRLAHAREALALLEAAAAAAPPPGSLAAFARPVKRLLEEAATVVERVVQTLLAQARQRLGEPPASQSDGD